MAITYPLTPPAAVARRITAFSLRLTRATAFNRSPFTYNRQVYEWPGAAWEADLDIAAGARVHAAAIEAFIASLRGNVGTFTLGPWYAAFPRGTQNQTGITASGAQSALATTLTVTGLGASKTVLAGTFLQVGSGSTSRLHIVVEAATANGSGVATLSIEPPLRYALSNGASVVFQGPQGLWSLAGSSYGITTGFASVAGPTSISIVEAL